MSQLNFYPLPFTSAEPPSELLRDIGSVSEHSDSVVFNTGLEERDKFLGLRGCVVCGTNIPVENCHIIGPSDHEVWQLLKRSGWLPEGTKRSPGHEPRNGLTLCMNHRILFDRLHFFIRFQPSTQKYILINYDSYGTSVSLRGFHGKAIALDVNHQHAPLPLLLLAHEYMVRGRNFIQTTTNVEIENNWQTWLIDQGVVNEKEDGSFSLNRDAPTRASRNTARQSARLQSSSHTGTAGPSQSIAPPTDAVIAELVESQHNMLSWKTWKREAMSWGGTADENITKYAENIGVEEQAATGARRTILRV